MIFMTFEAFFFHVIENKLEIWHIGFSCFGFDAGGSGDVVLVVTACAHPNNRLRQFTLFFRSICRHSSFHNIGPYRSHRIQNILLISLLTLNISRKSTGGMWFFAGSEGVEGGWLSGPFSSIIIYEYIGISCRDIGTWDEDGAARANQIKSLQTDLFSWRTANYS